MSLPKTFLTVCSIWLLCSPHILEALIVPQEVATLLSVVYSYIPPIKKGTDSRLGFGFRLGNHADFQVLVELGPQKETRPLGDQSNDSSFNKRQISKSEQNEIIRQQIRQQLLQMQEAQELTSTERSAATWLENWSQGMNVQQKKSSKSKSKQRDTKKPQVLPTQSLQQLQLLYKMATTTTAPPTAESVKVSTEETTLLAAQMLAERLKRKAQVTRELMNVSLEDGE